MKPGTSPSRPRLSSNKCPFNGLVPHSELCGLLAALALFKIFLGNYIKTYLTPLLVVQAMVNNPADGHLDCYLHTLFQFYCHIYN